jgi:D-sedoheptulose 7-phosphate isomerase
MDFLNDINGYFSKLTHAFELIDRQSINKLTNLLLNHYDRKTQIFIFGNGGSGATASHVVCDFNKGACLNLEKKFKFMCLNDNLPTLLAYSNDLSYDDVFYQQLRNFCNQEDLVIGISGSGNSKNVLKGIEYAKECGAATFSLCGFDGGRLRAIDTVNCIHVPVDDMQVVEDCHMFIFHLIMQALYEKLNCGAAKELLLATQTESASE